MEFSVDRGEFLEGLGLTQGVVERRNTLPILANALLDVSGGDLAIAATDLEVHVKRRLPAKIKKAGAATVGARKFYEFVRELKPGEVTVRLLENQFVEVVSGVCPRATSRLFPTPRRMGRRDSRSPATRSFA